METEILNPHDRFFKDMLSREEVGRDFILSYLPADVVALLDPASPELTKDTFVGQRG